MLAKNVLSSLFVGGEKKRCVPVCLFGTPDPVKVEKLFEEAMMVARDSFLNRWNYDVYTMEPSTRDGGLRWEPVRVCDNRGVGTEDGNRLDDLSGAARLVGEDETTRPLSGVEARTPIARGVRYNPYNKQQKLTDIWRNRKSSRLSSVHKSKTSKTFEESSDLVNHPVSQTGSSNASS